MQTETPITPPIAPLMKDPQTAQMLNMGEGWLRKDRTRPKPLIPFVKLGKAVRYSPAVIEQFIRNGGAA